MRATTINDSTGEDSFSLLVILRIRGDEASGWLTGEGVPGGSPGVARIHGDS